MTIGTFWLIVKTLLTVLPVIIDGIREGQIREGSQDELANVLGGKMSARADAAARARAEPNGVPDTQPDPADRADRE